VIAADFRMSVLTMKDGRVLNGIIRDRTDRTLTLQTMTERSTIERTEIAEQHESPQSLMPEGLLESLGDQQRRDLIAYLMGGQVPLPGAAQ
jgi:putative heme-binding domain-containing protein